MKPVKGQVYPGIISSPGQEAKGLILRGVPEEDVKKLDVYEGGEYERIQVDCTVDSETIKCFTYVFKYDMFLDDGEWSFEECKKRLRQDSKLFETELLDNRNINL